MVWFKTRGGLLGVLWTMLLVLVLSATRCSTAAVPTPAATMKKDTLTPEATIKKETPTPETTTKKETPTPGTAAKKETLNPLIAPHFVDSYPSHGQLFRQAPEIIVINFNFYLHEKSSISVTKDGMPVSLGKTTIDPNQLTMRDTLDGKSGDGLYVATYKACWPDGSCHDGQFAFQVDSRAATYLDMTGRPEVSISMQGLKFDPANIIISKETKVIWVNREEAIHFVNSDAHPSHNAWPDLNSQAIHQGKSYSFTFTQAGEWAYHCSAHVQQGMLGRIIVRE